MGRLIKAFLFKMTRDIAFRVVLIIGVGLAVLMTGLFFLMDLAMGSLSEEAELGMKFLSGPNMLLSAFNPVDNFGLAIPISLITFVCLEFTQGAIRNKIIAGHSKFRIYGSLYLSGLIMTFTLMITYASTITLLGTAFGGFNLDEPVMSMTSISNLFGGSKVDGYYIFQYLLVATAVYASITAFTIFFAALFRSVGPCIPIVIIVLMVLSLGGTLVSSFGALFENDFLLHAVKIVDPLFAISGGGAELMVDTQVIHIEMETFVASLTNNAVYAAIFFLGGAFIFANSDVK